MSVEGYGAVTDMYMRNLSTNNAKFVRTPKFELYFYKLSEVKLRSLLSKLLSNFAKLTNLLSNFY